MFLCDDVIDFPPLHKCRLASARACPASAWARLSVCVVMLGRVCPSHDLCRRNLVFVVDDVIDFPPLHRCWLASTQACPASARACLSLLISISICSIYGVFSCCVMSVVYVWDRCAGMCVECWPCPSMLAWTMGMFSSFLWSLLCVFPWRLKVCFPIFFMNYILFLTFLVYSF